MECYIGSCYILFTEQTLFPRKCFNDLAIANLCFQANIFFVLFSLIESRTVLEDNFLQLDLPDNDQVTVCQAKQHKTGTLLYE